MEGDRAGPRGRRLLLAALFAAMGAGSAIAQSAPSFDCAKAKSVAEKAICADPGLSKADATVARAYAAALQRLDARGRKRLAQDQLDFMQYRDRMADINANNAATPPTFDLGEFLNDRATFLASVRAPKAGFVGAWKNIQGNVDVKPGRSVKFEISAETANPVTGGSDCVASGSAAAGNELRLVDLDDNDKATGFVFTFNRDGDTLIAKREGRQPYAANLRRQRPYRWRVLFYSGASIGANRPNPPSLSQQARRFEKLKFPDHNVLKHGIFRPTSWASNSDVITHLGRWPIPSPPGRHLRGGVKHR